MNIFIRPVRAAWKRHLPAVLALLCISLAFTTSSAATITWSGAGGDNLWSNPANWNGGALPTGEDDVVINVPGNVTVRMDLFNVIVRSLQCQESFHLEFGGALRVTGGSSFINGAFRVSPNYWGIEAHGSETVLTFNGPVTNVTSLSATAGGIINLPTVGQLTVDAASAGSFNSSYSGLFAVGAGSAILMTNLTNVIIVPSYHFRVEASSGGRIDLRRLKIPEGPIQLNAQSPDSLIDVSSFSGRWALGPDYPGWANVLTADSGGTVLIPNVTAMESAIVSVTGMTNAALSQIRSFAGGSLSLTSRTNGLNSLTNFSGSLSAYDSRLDLTNFTVLHATNDSININAYNGSVVDLSRVAALLAPNGRVWISAEQNSAIDLSGVTNVVPYAFSGARAVASSGSRIDLRRLRVPDGPLGVAATGPDSVVDLSGLNGEWATPGSFYGASGVAAWDRGTVLIPNVTSMRYLSLDLRHDSAVPTTQIRSFTDGSISLTSRTNGFEGLTNFSGTFYVSDTRLDLTNFTTLYATNSGLAFYAYAGSRIDLSRLTNVVTLNSGYGLQAIASDGGFIDLSRLRMPAGPIYASVTDSGSLVDLSGLSGVWRDANVAAYSGGTLLIPHVTAMEGASMIVSGDAKVNLAQIASFTGSSITLTSRTNDFLGLTNIAGTTIGVADSVLTLTNVTTLYTTNGGGYFSANYGSVIDLSRVTNWVSSGWGLSLYAYNGSRIDLSRLPAPEWPLSVDARFADSAVDLSGFAGLWGYGSVIASFGASVLIPNVTAMENFALDLSYDANVPTAQLGSFNGGLIGLVTQTNVFASLTNFTGTLGCLGFGRAELPGLTQVATTGTPSSFTAGYDGLILLPNVQTIASGSGSVTADGAGAIVDLSSLSGFFSDNNSGTLTARNGGTLLLNTNAMLLAGVAIDIQSNPGDVLPTFVAPSQSVVLYGRPWQAYRVESRDPAAGSPWTLYARVPLTSPLQELGSRPPGDTILRVSLWVADPPELGIRRASPGAVELILFGVPERSYRVDTRTALSTGEWETRPAIALTNAFHIFPVTATTNSARFYRAQKL